MEAVDEKLADLPTADIVKSNTTENEDAAVAVAADLCQNSNGVAEIGKAGQPEETNETNGGNELEITPETEKSEEPSITPDTIEPIENESSGLNIPAQENDKVNINESPSPNDQLNQDINMLDVNEVVTEVVIDDDIEKTVSHEEEVIEVSNLKESLNDTPKFKTEILIEANDNTADTTENTLSDADGHNTPNNISLQSEFGESIELSEVLRSDVTVAIENNTGSVRQEVFNKEELLDILQGNDVESPSAPVAEAKQIEIEVNFNSPTAITKEKQDLKTTKEIETKLALQQLSRLKSEKRKYGPIKIIKDKKEKRGSAVKINNIESTPEKKLNQDELSKISDSENAANSITKKTINKESVQADNIVNVLVMDWEDDEQETNDSAQPKEPLVQSENLSNESDKLKNNQEVIVNKEKTSVRSSVDSTPGEDQVQRGKSGDENQPQRRLGRVIKKKVIFDPDNPDTFTKSKTKNREVLKDHIGKEQPPLKKIKNEQSPQRSKSKSPMLNLQWKKPSSKNSKQNRRLTEVDKLLMDEGAVNMIYQLTPEAPKGKKSRETKAEFIKKIQSSTPDGKEMKFRERKKETLKYEDGDSKKILGGKHKLSLNSSIKSPSVSEDFETHSADDSIIYRRHSSSSYSSSCMSPRRLSDVDSSTAITNTQLSNPSSDNQRQDTSSVENKDQETDIFMANKSGIEVLNKDDYLSIKEKLNSKLSLALNKRKRESNKNEKLKQKKTTKCNEKNENATKRTLGEFKYVTIKIDQRLAEISVEHTGLQYCIEVLKEIEEALIVINDIKDISVTLLTPECGTFFSNLDLKHIIEDKMERVNNALEVAETIRSLQLTVDKHSKLVCSGVHSACRGVGLALVALSDVVLASERASFAVAAPRAPLQPAAAALTARCRLPHSMVNDLILFGRQLSATEALHGGLVSRVLWPERFMEQVHDIVKEIASEPAQNIMLKKQLISLKKSGEHEQTFLSYLDTERDVFVEYWTSSEGQDMLRTADNAV